MCGLFSKKTGTRPVPNTIFRISLRTAAKGIFNIPAHLLQWRAYPVCCTRRVRLFCEAAAQGLCRIRFAQGGSLNVDRRAFGHDCRAGGRLIRPAYDQGRIDYPRGKALLARGLSRRRSRSQLSHLGQLSLGRRLPRALDERRVLQAPRRVSREQLWTAVGNPQDSRDRGRRRGRWVRSDDVLAALAIRPGGDVRRDVCGRRRANCRRAVARAGRGHSDRESPGVAPPARRAEKSPCVRGRLAGAHAKRDAHGHLSCR